ncbi:MAG: anaerobic ribonucleoside-triphosphate reductase activating protein [Acetanaerobacterium sp.]
MAYNLRISGIVEESSVDGPGLRYTLFTQGCPHACPGCHNPQTHSFEGGRMVDIEDILKAIEENPLLRGVTFSGGEPFSQAAPLAVLAGRIHERTTLNVLTYTGYTWEELLQHEDPAVRALLEQTDVLIDGRYLEAQRDLTLRFRGSANQRVIDVKKSLDAGAPMQISDDLQ